MEMPTTLNSNHRTMEREQTSVSTCGSGGTTITVPGITGGSKGAGLSANVEFCGVSSTGAKSSIVGSMATGGTPLLGNPARVTPLGSGGQD